MEKSAVKTYKDPALNKLIQEKSNWNRQVSALINDLIHFKKSMNGWPSKFYKERSRITQPVPVDLAGILGKMTSEWQEIATQGNSLVQEQAEFAKTHVKRKSDSALDKLDKMQEPGNAVPAQAKPAGTDLSQQIGRQLGASSQLEIIKLATVFEGKYFLESEASNPFSRFITRLFNPKLGFGEGARIRRLRMEMLSNCVKSYKELKKLHKEIVKSSKSSIVNSHNFMKIAWNYWNAVNRLLTTYKAIRPDAVVADTGGQLETDPELKKEKAMEEGREPDVDQETAPSTPTNETVIKIKDFREASGYLGTNPEVIKNPSFLALNSLIEGILAAPKNKRMDLLQKSNIEDVYATTLTSINQQLGTQANSFREAVQQYQKELNDGSQPTKTAQLGRWLGKARHQAIPTATSGQRLEVYRFISQIRKDLNEVMDLLEKGFDEKMLTEAIGRVNREMAQLRIMMRSLYYSVKPEEASSPFF